MKLAILFFLLFFGIKTFSQKIEYFVLNKKDAIDTANIDSLVQFGHEFEVNISSLDFGNWEDNGQTKTWKLGIACPNAFSINMVLKDLNISKGGIMIIRNASSTVLLGPFTNELRHESGYFGIPLIHDDSVILEFTQPNSLPNSKIIIKQIVYGFRDILLDLNDGLEKDFGDAAYCEVNTACYENLWCRQINSVGLIVNGGQRHCSGALITNSDEDRKPYFLTARHCMSHFNPAGWVFYFNYQSKECFSNVDGRLIYSVSGATLRADGKTADYALLELHSNVPYSYNPYYSGWDAGTGRPKYGVTIHHPSADVKKVSTYSEKPKKRNWDVEFIADTTTRKVWKVVFSEGDIEPGSSGAPLFDDRKLIVGIASGSDSPTLTACAQEYVYFGRFRKAMQNGARQFIDPSANIFGHIIAMSGIGVSTCPVNRSLSGTVTNGLHSASNNIVVSGNTVLYPGQVVEIRAGNHIQLLPGFKASHFSSTKIIIADCESTCYNLKSKDERFIIYEKDTLISERIEVRVSPNPTEGQFSISLNSFNTSSGNIHVTIYDIMGRSIYSNKMSQSELSIDIENYPNGIYILYVETKGKSIKQKIIKT